ncbi:MAG: hypothetical protein CM15mP124_1040 [Alphaproteobacteria bacterium]|nr:MAG: hypothetical protein CM15mP124_1040 [Alphaproteobacteria bacterium]
MQLYIWPAMANEAGIKFDLFDVADIFKSTPYIADLKPGGNLCCKKIYMKRWGTSIIKSTC